MGIKNYLIEGVSGTGKTSVCDEMRRQGYHSIHGDRELAYQGDPRTVSLWMASPTSVISGTSIRFIARLYATEEDTPKNAIIIDATAPISRVVDAILGNAN